MNSFLAFIFILALGIFCVAEFTSATRMFKTKNKKQKQFLWSMLVWEIIPLVLIGSLVCVGWIEFQKRSTASVATAMRLLMR